MFSIDKEELEPRSILPLNGKIWLPFLTLSVLMLVLCTVLVVFAYPLFFGILGPFLLGVCILSFVAGLLIENAVAAVVIGSRAEGKDYHWINHQLGGEKNASIEVNHKPVVPQNTPLKPQINPAPNPDCSSKLALSPLSSTI
ncbi:MAG: hypothetical protein WC785_01680 [Tatlockia sp.]|jgi:hypothetical protein